MGLLDVPSYSRPTADGRFANVNTVVDRGFRGVPDISGAASPTVTLTNDNATPTTTVPTPKTLAGTSYASYLCDDLTSYTPLGAGTTLPVRGTTGLNTFGCNWFPGSTGVPSVVRLETIMSGRYLSALVFQSAGAQYRIRVGNQYLTRYPQTIGGVAGKWAEIKLDFGSRDGYREVTLELTNGTTGYTMFWGFSVQNQDSLHATAGAARRLCIVGDSYGAGAASSAVGTFVPWLAQSLGFRDFVNACIGGTGWLATGSGANIATRLATDVIAHAPTDIVITLGHNDQTLLTGGSITTGQLTTQVQTVIASIRSALPSLRNLVVTGPLYQGSAIGTFTNSHNAIRAGIDSKTKWVDTIASPIFTGSGYSGTPANNGNSDLFIASDNTHPTDAGNEYLGITLGHRVRPLIAA